MCFAWNSQNCKEREGKDCYWHSRWFVQFVFLPPGKDELFFFFLFFFISLNFLLILTGLCSGMTPAILHYFPASCSEAVTCLFPSADVLSCPSNQCEEVQYIPQMKSFFDNRLLGSGSVPRLHAVILRCSLIALKELPQPPDLDLSGSRGFHSTVTGL